MSAENTSITTTHVQDFTRWYQPLLISDVRPFADRIRSGWRENKFLTVAVSVLLVVTVNGREHEERHSSNPQEEVDKDPPSFVRIPTPLKAPLDQGNRPGCGPTSLLNQLKFGPESYRDAYHQIVSDNDNQALDLLLTRYFNPKDDPKALYFNPQGGVDDTTLTLLSQRVAVDFQLEPNTTIFTTRKEQEKDQAFITRINQAIITSLTRGIPLVMSVDSYGVSEKKWKKLTGHYMLITGAQPLAPLNQSNFLIEYIDPAGAVRGQALAHIPHRKHYGAFAHLPQGNVWLEGNPYLALCVPDINLREGSLTDDVRHELFLTLLIGQSGEKK